MVTGHRANGYLATVLDSRQKAIPPSRVWTGTVAPIQYVPDPAGNGAAVAPPLIGERHRAGGRDAKNGRLTASTVTVDRSVV